MEASRQRGPKAPAHRWDPPLSSKAGGSSRCHVDHVMSTGSLLNGPLVFGFSPSIHPPAGNTKIIAAASPRGNQGCSKHLWPRGRRVGRLCILMGAPASLQSTICSALSALWQGSGRERWRENK